MPKFFRTEYKVTGGDIAHVRQRENGTFEIRYRRDGLNISASGKTLEIAKQRFIKKLCNASKPEVDEPEPQAEPVIRFEPFTMQWLDVVKKPQIKETTYQSYLLTLRTYILPAFGKRLIRDIKPMDVQELLNAIEQKGASRMAEKAYTILKPIFDFAIAQDLIAKSPMTLIRKPKHETRHGEALTAAEERSFVTACLNSNSPCRFAFLLLLFTGIRRSELASATVSEEWITVTTSKTRKGASAKKRKIPVTPKLKPYLALMTKENLNVSTEDLTRAFPKLSPGHHLHELRHTFITRCQECGVSRELTSLWAGHRADGTMTSNVYTHFSDAFQLQEALKINYL